MPHRPGSGHNRVRQIDTNLKASVRLAFVFQGDSNNLRSFFRPYIHAIFPTVLLLISAVITLGQATGFSEEATAPNPVLQKIERARALAAVHQLQAAAVELENVRASVNDVTIRNAATLMLLGIYLEDGNYGRSQALLEETFQARATQKDESIRTYFAAAGQTVNGLRSHLARYRNYGLNPGDANLPVEANIDLERVRGLLERMIAQAREISKEAGRAYDSLALLEDVLGTRLQVARNDDDRAKWQTEYLAAREKMASSPFQTISLGRSQALDAVTNKIPNPFTKPSETAESTPAPTPVPAATPAPATSSEPQMVSAGSLSGRETKRVAPSYPSTAKSHNVTGTVRVFAIVDENGKIWVTNSEGPMMLRAAAEDAAKNWTFPPSVFNNRPARIAGYIDFEFKL